MSTLQRETCLIKLDVPLLERKKPRDVASVCFGLSLVHESSKFKFHIAYLRAPSITTSCRSPLQIVTEDFYAIEVPVIAAFLADPMPAPAPVG